MKIFFKIIKLLLSTVFLFYTILIAYFLFFSPKEKRFEIGETLQGTYLSQTIFDILIWQYPNYSNAYMEKSVAFNKRGEYSKGFSLLNKAVDIDPSNHLGYRGWLRLVKLKDYKGAIGDLERLDSLTPNFEDYPWGENIHYLLGICYNGLGDFKRAKYEYNIYFNSEKDSTYLNSMAFVYYGNILLEQDSLNKANDLFNIAIKIDKYRTEAYYLKGIYYKKINELDSSNINLKKALKLYDDGYKNQDSYNEVFQEIYRNDIEIEILNLSE
ncbi:tetratricopeptide repeat protein [Moheibacter lacus]|uniref:Tetratricopeptide repeat-containing protein n=1 Tax=Moheibacter lacus TaxID=2745851 RepID=A0A838ZSA8_9FLAO|nr:hypothetical protein [Moheibacter lacus]MBA5629239.1 hypothetical protein [Moheibacter lacus]